MNTETVLDRWLEAASLLKMFRSVKVLDVLTFLFLYVSDNHNEENIPILFENVEIATFFKSQPLNRPITIIMTIKGPMLTLR